MQGDQDDGAAEIDFLAKMKSPSDFGQDAQLFIKAKTGTTMRCWVGPTSPGTSTRLVTKDAADALVVALADARYPLTAWYPLVFLYRQGLELQLKLILPLARRLAGKEASADIGHKLMPLWNELRQHLRQLDPREDDKSCPAIEDFIRQLDTVDHGSFAFRYPTTTKGECRSPSCGTST